MVDCYKIDGSSSTFTSQTTSILNICPKLKSLTINITYSPGDFAFEFSHGPYLLTKLELYSLGFHVLGEALCSLLRECPLLENFIAIECDFIVIFSFSHLLHHATFKMCESNTFTTLFSPIIQKMLFQYQIRSIAVHPFDL